MILSETRIKNMKRGKLCELYILCALLCTVAFVNGSELLTTNLFQTLSYSTASPLNSVHGLKTQGLISSMKRQK